jgi:hypothetical protein
VAVLDLLERLLRLGIDTLVKTHPPTAETGCKRGRADPASSCQVARALCAGARDLVAVIAAYRAAVGDEIEAGGCYPTCGRHGSEPWR